MRKQIQEFHQEYGYTYTGMLKTLYWWYEIKDHTTELAQNGIGIVPYVPGCGMRICSDRRTVGERSTAARHCRFRPSEHHSSPSRSDSVPESYSGSSLPNSSAWNSSSASSGTGALTRQKLRRPMTNILHFPSRDRPMS